MTSHNFAYPCSIPGIDAGKNSRETLNADGTLKYKAVTEIALEMVVRFTRTKCMLCVYDGAIVDSQPFYREKVGGIICGLCGGQRPVG